ncbi:MAG: hypothetical protein CMJ94_04815 [Planctomycetes bacterium]|nr:hypothetical protein [Planctomycetota bacterium]
MNILSLPIVVVIGSMALAMVGLFIGIRLAGMAFGLVGRLLQFVVHEVRDSLLFAATVIRAIFTLPRVLLAVVLGRWSAVRHHGQAIEVEVVRAGRLAYQVVIGNLIELLGIEGHVIVSMDPDGGVIADEVEAILEEALAEPEPGQSPSDVLAGKAPKPAKKERAAAMRATPGRDKPKRADQFEGYRVVGSLPTGGSGAKIYVADLDEDKRASLTRAGLDVPGQVVIKCFQLDEGSNLSQIVRESRALESAKRLGMVLEHGLDERRYFYVMPYVPGENLSRVTQKMHAGSGADGLGNKQIQQALGYVADLLVTLDRFHAAGLWHKDVKPDNIIVREGRAHLVDLGLVTPLGSAMTLTTHGTEYFRDPELVRQALRGAKVHEVDGARFDLYAAGAVLYSIVEDSFPAHGSLSSISKRCPDSLQWIVRRAMADLDSRYRDAAEMLADVRKVQEAADAFAVKPAQLPSMGGSSAVSLPEPPPTQALPPRAGATLAGAASAPPPVPGDGYRPGPETGAYAEESARRMPPPVPSKARAHALNAAREAKNALEAVRNARWDARDARKRARAKLADARKRAAEVRQQAAGMRDSMKKRADGFVAKLPKHTRDAIAATAPKPKAARKSHAERRAEKRAAKEARKARHSGGPTWGGWSAVAVLMLVGIAGLVAASSVGKISHIEMGYDADAQARTISVSRGDEPQLTVIRHDEGGNSVIVHESPAPAGPPLFDKLASDEAPLSRTLGNRLIGDASWKDDFPIARQKGRVLIINQLRAGQDEEASLRALETELQDAGYALVDPQFEGEGADQVIDLVARGRKSIALYTPFEEQPREKLLQFLHDTPELDAVIWVGYGDSSKEVRGFVGYQPSFSKSRLLRVLDEAELMEG